MIDCTPLSSAKINKLTSRAHGKGIDYAFSVCMEGGEVEAGWPGTSSGHKYAMCCNKAVEKFTAGILLSYTVQELFIATDGWASTNLFGEGEFGKVCIGKLYSAHQ